MNNKTTACYCRQCNRVTAHTLFQEMSPIGPTELTYDCQRCHLRTLEHNMGYDLLPCRQCGRAENASISQPHICSACGYRNEPKVLIPIDITKDPELALLTGLVSLDEIPTRGEVS